jgi:hypothetical protein
MFDQSQMLSFNGREKKSLLPAAVQQISSHATCTVQWTAVPLSNCVHFLATILTMLRVCVT